MLTDVHVVYIDNIFRDERGYEKAHNDNNHLPAAYTSNGLFRTLYRNNSANMRRITIQTHRV